MNPLNMVSSLSLSSILLLLTATTLVVSEAQDDVAECEGWASSGECSLNPGYMMQNCPVACARQAEADTEMAAAVEAKIGHIKSFFELEADDIDKKPLKFDQFAGKVTVVTNVASYCGYTESHYAGLVKLYNQFQDSPAMGFNILAFPCNQFGEQEPEECPAIKRFAKKKGVKFTMMDKVDVNGIDAHPVYHYLKKVAGPPHIGWNFETYYVVAPDGTVQSMSGVLPADLIPAITEAMGAEPEL